jgi:hypothetical protein
MSCAGFTILGVYIAATNKGNGWVVGGSAFLATVFFVVAAYRTWRDEHDTYTSEVAKNQRPDIRGEAFDLSGEGIYGEGYDQPGHWSVSCQSSFELYLCNHNPVNTTLKAIELDGSRLRPPVTFDFDRLNIPDGTELVHGIGTKFTVQVNATVEGMRLADISPIAMDDLRVNVVDAFDHKHPIPIRQGERLKFGER